MNNGLETAILIALAIIVVILGLMLYAKLKPNSAVGKDVARVETDAQAFTKEFGSSVQRYGRLFIDDAEALAAGFKRIEPALQTELQSLLTAAEKRLTDLSSEDSDIATAQEDWARATATIENKIKAANDAKALKLQLVKAHIDTLQAHVAANTPPVSGS